jgi:hypothetical protein
LSIWRRRDSRGEQTIAEALRLLFVATAHANDPGPEGGDRTTPLIARR